MQGGMPAKKDEPEPSSTLLRSAQKVQDAYEKTLGSADEKNDDGGIVQPIRKSDIKDRRVMKESIMPEDLQKGLTVQELVDLVEYLQTLKKK